MIRAAVTAFVLFGLAACEERVVTCEEAVRHVAGIMKDSESAQKREFWTNKRALDGQIAFCKREKTDPELLRCAIDASNERQYEACVEKYVDR